MSAGGQMSAEERKSVVQDFYDEVFEKGNIEIADDILHPEYVLHDREAGPNEEYRGPDVVKDLIEATQDFFTGEFQVTDFKVTVVEQLVAEEDRVVTRFRVNGNLGANPMEVRGTSISRVSDGKITASWSNWESGLLLKQLGLVKPIEEPGGGEDARGKWPPPFRR